jgi:hypothetical protein
MSVIVLLLGFKDSPIHSSPQGCLPTEFLESRPPYLFLLETLQKQRERERKRKKKKKPQKSPAHFGEIGDKNSP